MKTIVPTMAALALIATSASAQEKTATLKNEHKQVVVTPETATAYEMFRYAPAVRANGFLFLSGIVAEQREGEQDPSAAYKRAFAEIESILAASGASWANVVDVTSYHTDFDNDFVGFWAFKEKRVPAPYPAWTAIGVSSLFAANGGRAVVEIKVTAVIDDESDADADDE